MSNRAELENTMAKFYVERNRADLEAAMKLFDPSCSFRIVGTRRLDPLTKPVENLDNLRAAARQLFETWDLSGLRNLSVHVDGDTVYVHRRGTVRFIPGDLPFETEVIDKVTFRDGLITEFLQFADTYHIAEVCGLGQKQ